MRKPFGFSERPPRKPKIEMHYRPHHYIKADGTPDVSMIYDSAEGRIGRHIRDGAIKDFCDFGDEMSDEVRMLMEKHFSNCERCCHRKAEIERLNELADAQPQELQF